VAVRSRKELAALSVILLLATVLTGCGRKEEAPTPTPETAVQAGAINPETCWSADQRSSEQLAGKPQWTSPPAIVVDPAGRYTATLQTNKGAFQIEFLPAEAPQTVSNFLCLAAAAYYDGVPFHRVIQGFMIQGGDPSGTGAGGPGYSFADELPQGRPYQRGTVAMANAGPNTNGSQFFVCLADGCNGLPPQYTIFGTVIAGMETVDAIAAVPVGPNPGNPSELSSPQEQVLVQSASVEVA
jgi:cyclophilin family peptidyl-prolyl cis-trans isomerase